MQRIRPLPTNPEFSVLHSASFHEFRVENWHISRDGSGSVVRGASSWSWTYSLLPLMISVAWRKAGYFTRVLLCLVVVLVFWTRCTQVIHESLIVLPAHGIQLETHRGFPPFTLFISRRFVSHTVLRDIVINEGIKRWDIRYYLVALEEGSTGLAFEICFPNILPHFPILLQIYRDLREFVAVQGTSSPPQILPELNGVYKNVR
ncbi:hypothetical protein GYMLUDRAFT_44261 [Collybiopsis luxurians FD-317 M1]|uniref:Phosphatidylinositol N-acetylglucosaminyltransferase subunit H conserved domain-containing protein n=1 Tax=Collybiopsis luxurians FD-317 M1 TaxID=944289 RepID=A0A0D0CV32_9AGAR|nr:hypothetical protein GYMLUDRAFT_44261 [Collybiopsis luxurians FD-317 M1]